MVSDKYSCIFIHIPRTAGHTVSEIFNMTSEELHPKKGLGRHSFPSDYLNNSKDKWYKYFKKRI